MKHILHILPLLLLLASCHSPHHSNMPNELAYDSVYTIADLQWHKQYYPTLDQQVFSVDLLTDGLAFDSAYHITGTGLNLFFSDIFLPLTDSLLTEGAYCMDTTASSYTFLPYMNFDGNITGCYMLDIQESSIKRIIGFTSGEFEIHYVGDDIRMDITLFQADSTCYRAVYQGPCIYR